MQGGRLDNKDPAYRWYSMLQCVGKCVNGNPPLIHGRMPPRISEGRYEDNSCQKPQGIVKGGAMEMPGEDPQKSLKSLDLLTLLLEPASC